MKLAAPDKNEFEKAAEWLKQDSMMPDDVRLAFKKIISVYAGLTAGKAKAQGVLQTLRQAMGFIPKSESGRQILNETASPELSDDCKKEIAELKKKRNGALAEFYEYSRRIKNLVPCAKKLEQGCLEFLQPSEMIFSYPTVDRLFEQNKVKVDRVRNFNKTQGLKVSFDKTTRVSLAIKVIETEYQVETLEDPYTGKRVRASMLDIGPNQFQLTWLAIGNLVKMHVGFAIPMNRLELMIGQPEFTSSKMCRVFEYLAENLYPVYLELAQQLSQVKIISGDDTSTKIIDMTEGPDHTFSAEIDKKLGWHSEKADGSGKKKTLNVSLLMGRTEAEPRSTIRFFRTHRGNLGNLISRILEFRRPSSGQLVFQGDLASFNLPDNKFCKLFSILVAACGSHARRPFWRYRNSDPDLCYYMLSAFLMLSQLEKRIDLKGRSGENILKYRGRYGRMIWQAIKNRCEESLSGEKVGRFPNKSGLKPLQWAPGMDLHQACKYVLKNFEELTRYLDNPHLQYTNNGSERALRIEKCMLDSSKFRKTRKGRAVLDVLRTINATCTAAGIDITEYLKYYFKNKDQAVEKLTPYRVALELEKLKSA